MKNSIYAYTTIETNISQYEKGSNKKLLHLSVFLFFQIKKVYKKTMKKIS